MNEVIEAIFRRRSIRKYTPQEVEAEKLDLLLQAGMAAPSAMNSQPWEFIVVTDKEKLGLLQRRLIFGHRNAPAAIVVCGNPRIAKNAAGRLFWVQDCSAAAENILIAATSLGLGSVWIGIYPVRSFMKIVSEILFIPKSVTPLCVVYVGYPAEAKPPRTRYVEKRVFWQQYKPRKRRVIGKNTKNSP